MSIVFAIYIIGVTLALAGGIIFLFLRHQQRLKDRAFMMREAVRNGDYTFLIEPYTTDK